MRNIVNIVPNNASADEIFDDCKGEFKEVLILGWDHDNLMKVKSSSSLDVKDIIYMCEIFKQVLLTSGYENK